jgi:hypothetical protein
MRLVLEKPAIYETLQKQFGIVWESGVVITYGDTCYCVHNISQDVMAHEEVHMHRQLAMGVEKWWDRYLKDPEFRVQEELEAYRKQYIFIKKNSRDRRVIFNESMRLARDLSSSMYGGVCTFQQAITAITGDVRCIK